MKQIYFAAIVVASVALFASCQKEEASEILSQQETPVVTLQLSNDSNSTKGFFDESSEAESFEKSISSLSVIVFDSQNNLVSRRNFTSDEITARRCTFKLPKTVAGTNCKFYTVANLDIDAVSSYQSLVSLLEQSPGDYNGTFSEVVSAAKRSGGFVMSGFTQQKIAAMGSTTSVSTTLKRTVSKIALKATISDKFQSLYGGKLTILSTEIDNAPSSTYLIEPATSTSSIESDYTTSQDVSGEPKALYYIYENEHIKNNPQVSIKINALYDVDGDDTTTNDRQEFTYSFTLTGSGNGIIKRNSYYRIAATINGPEGGDCSLAISVSNWESPSTQDVSLGI